MRWLKLGIFALLVAALVGFNLLFKDRLLEQGLEAALEGIFQAKAEVDGLHLGLLGGHLRLRSVSVADASEPMTNLFELGPAEFRLDTLALLRRKIVIEAASCHDIRWGTPRAVSGALEARPAAGSEQRSPARSPSLPDLGALGFDPAEFLAQESARLRSPAAYQKADEALREASSRWQTRLSGLEGKLERVEQTAAGARAVDFRSVKTLEEARRAYEAVEGLASSLSDAERDLERDAADLKTDLAALRSMTSGAKAALEEDVRAVRNRVKLPEGGLEGVASGLARSALERRLGRFSSLAFRALEAAGRLREGRRDVPKKRPQRRAGRDVAFPTRAVPNFVLKAMSFSLRAEDASLGAELRDLTSQPELWGRPTSFTADYRSGALGLSVSGEIDAREAAPKAHIEARASGVGFHLSDLPWLGSASGDCSFSLQTNVEGRDTSGRAVVRLTSVRTGEAQDVVARVIRDSLESAREVSFVATYRMTGGEFSMDLHSNLDEEISRELRARLAQLEAEYRSRVEAELRKMLASQVSQVEKQMAQIQEGLSGLGSLGNRAAAVRKELEAKKAEYNAALARLGAGLEKRAREAIKIPGF